MVFDGIEVELVGARVILPSTVADLPLRVILAVEHFGGGVVKAERLEREMRHDVSPTGDSPAHMLPHAVEVLEGDISDSRLAVCVDTFDREAETVRRSPELGSAQRSERGAQ